MPETGSAGAQFDIARVRVIIEGVDKASEPIRKTKEQVEELSKKQKEIFPEKVMETMNTGWLKVGAAIAGVAGAVYGLVRISPIFGSYVSMFFQSLGVLLDQFIIPLMPALDFVIDKMTKVSEVAGAGAKILSGQPTTPQQKVEVIGGVTGGIVGGVVGTASISAIQTALDIPMPPWAKMVIMAAAVLMGVSAGAGFTSPGTTTYGIKNNLLDVQSSRPGYKEGNTWWQNIVENRPMFDMQKNLNQTATGTGGPR